MTRFPTRLQIIFVTGEAAENNRDEVDRNGGDSPPITPFPLFRIVSFWEALFCANSSRVNPVSHTQVLIVDDERINRRVLQGLLRSQGISTTEAEDGRQAINHLTENDVDLILLDINMEGMNGFEVLSEIRKQYSPTELSVVMVTADSGSSQVVHALQNGANDYVAKPIDQDEVLARIVTQLQLIDAHKALRASEERYSLAAKATNDGLWDWDIPADTIHFSDRWRSMLGIDESETLSRPSDWFNRIHSADRNRVRDEIDAHLAGQSPHIASELRMLHADGNYRWMHCRGLAFHDENGNAQRLAGSLSDVTARKVVDALTSLPNRMLFLDRLERSLENAQRHDDYDFAVLFIDLDGFKLINDSLGHDVGDQLLITIAQRLELSVRSHETVVGRLGGDEFAILIERINHSRDAQMVAERVLERICEPCLIDGIEIFPCASIGMSFGKSESGSAEELIREADTAMYEAKSQGKSRIIHFNPEMHRELSERLNLQNQLRRAVLQDDQLVLHYLPVINLQDNSIIGFEALIRWQHPEWDLVGPDKFIPIAEETGLVVPIGKWAMEEACKQLAEWEHQFPTHRPFVSVNVSSRQLVERELVKAVRVMINETGANPAHLKLEVTESAIMANPDDFSFVMSGLREMGIKTGIDDFGTGYSSLACLHRLPLDLLKIDRSFISELLSSTESEAIVGTIIKLAESLNLDVIAEGIESEKQAAHLRSMGCKLGQGFHYSKPLTAEEATVLMETRDSPSTSTNSRLPLAASNDAVSPGQQSVN